MKRPEPLVGFEPTTARLRIECSTPELQWQRTSRMPWRGFEPRRLSAPPPQDGVSTSFTTRALYYLHAFVDERSGTHSPTHPLTCKPTGPTGLEPATSRVTVECSNQAELRPLARIGGSVANPHRHRIRSPAPATACHRGIPLTHPSTHSLPRPAHRSRPYDHSP